MKKIIYSTIIIFTCFSVKSQQMNFVEHDLTYDTLDLSFTQCGTMKVDSIDIDVDGTVDITIASFFEHIGCGVRSAIAVLVKDYDTGDLEYNGHITNDQNGLVKNCATGGSSNFTSNSSYIFLSNEDSPNNAIHTNGYYKVPFEFETADGVHCGFLFVRYENGGKTITVEGYSWNPIAGQSCSCNGTGWLGLEEPDGIEIDKVNFIYYNFLGQRVDAPEGLVLKVYESGITEKVYLAN